MNKEVLWENPTLSEKTFAQFPIESLPPFLGDFCKAIALEVQVPIELPFFAALSVISAATCGNVEVQVRGRYREALSFYSLIGLGSGNRKSEVLRTLKAPLLEIEKVQQDEVKPNRASQIAERKALEQALEGLQSKARNKGVTPSLHVDIQQAAKKVEDCRVMREPRIFADNVTPERHAALIATYNSIAIIEPEGGFFEGLSRYGKSNTPQVDYLNKSYGGEPFRFDRQHGEAIQAENPHAVLHFSIQPHIVREIKKNPHFTGTGFANRFLYSLPQSLIGQRSFETPPVAIGLIQGWQMSIAALHKACITNPGRQLTIEQSALALLKSFQEAIEPQLASRLQPIEGWASKLPGQLIRIAALYELAANPSAGSVSPESMEAAIFLAPYLEEHALKALAATGDELPAYKLLTYLVEKQESFKPLEIGSVGYVGAISYQFTTRTLHAQFNKNSFLRYSEGQATLLRGLLQELAKDYWVQRIEVEPGKQGGRPTELWAVNPKAPESFRRLYG